MRRRVVGGFTLEALTNVLEDNPCGVLIHQDELTQLIGSFDAYKSNKGSDRPQMLTLFDGRRAEPTVPAKERPTMQDVGREALSAEFSRGVFARWPTIWMRTGCSSGSFP